MPFGMSNHCMNDFGNINRNPFTVPDGYFETLEDRVRDRIRRPVTPAVKFATRVKPAFMLAVMFGAIAGLGWIASKVTGLLYQDPASTEDPIMAMIEEGYLESSFIYAYYDEIDLDNAFTYYLEDNVTIDGELEEYLEASLTEEDMLRYMDENMDN